MLIALSANASTWQYHNTIDPMTDEFIYEASILSKNAVNLDIFGLQKLKLKATHHPRNGWEVELSLAKGQISCSVSCYVTFRFDDEKASKFLIEQVFNTDESVYRIKNDAESVAEGLFQSTKVLTEISVYRKDNQFFRFETDLFDFSHFPHKPGEQERLINTEKARFSKLYSEIIKNNWRKPDNLGVNEYAVVYFNIDLLGKVSSLIVLPTKNDKGIPNLHFKRSIEEAILKSSPLPISDNDEVRSALHRFSLKFPE